MQVNKDSSLLVDNKIIIHFKEKVNLFNDYFLDQCKPIANNSVLSTFNLLTNSKLNSVLINENIILNIIKNINVNKVYGADNISGRMIEICGEKIALPLNIIFTYIINTGIFLELWKSANVKPTHKK